MQERENISVPNIHLRVCQKGMLVLTFIYVHDTTLWIHVQYSV